MSTADEVRYYCCDHCSNDPAHDPSYGHPIQCAVIPCKGAGAIKPTAHRARQANIAQVIRDEMERIGADQGMTLADYDSIARVVLAMPCSNDEWKP
jgi:hypothetical protein